MVEKGLLWEVSRGRSTRRLGRTEQFIVSKYTKITLTQVRINKRESIKRNFRKNPQKMMS